MSARLLATKFHIPSRRAGLVARPRLRERLETSVRDAHKLALISAPAGYGKTTLLADWLASLTSMGRRESPLVSWLSLDEADNDAVCFMRYFLAALQLAHPAIGSLAQKMLEMPQLPSLTVLLDEVLNDLAGIDTSLVLVLDDYHTLSNPDIHAAIDYFLDHQPASFCLILTTRTDPPLRMARLRARRQMTEIRAPELRFTPEEARAFFGLANLQLAEDALRALDERTEGWAAGMQLAALALQQQPDPANLIETFRGSHRYVLDYLASEVLHQQGEDIRDFMLHTGLLDQFNAELCRALTGREESQALIDRLDQTNLFVIPLDHERRWYRYHHLFADFARSLLSKAEKTTLYQRAAAWHEAHDLIPEAVRYALAAGDNAFAADVVERALDLDSTWSVGNLTQLSAWLEALPLAVIDGRPHLSIHRAHVLYLQGRFDQAETQLTCADSLLHAGVGSADAERLSAMVALNRGMIAAVRGDYLQALALIPTAQARLPAGHHQAHARAYFSLGLACELSRHTSQAVEYYLNSAAEARIAGILYLDMHGLCAAAQLQIGQGRLTLAERTCREAIQRAAGAHLPPLGLAWHILGAIALERNDLSTAERHLRDGIALSRQGGLLDDLVVGLAVLGRLRAYQRDLVGLQATIDEVMAIVRGANLPRSEQLAGAHLARYHLFLGQREAVFQWVGAYQLARAEPLRDYEELTLARALMALGEPRSASGILLPVLKQATTAGRGQTVLEATMLLGLCLHAQGKVIEGLNLLRQALRQAAPEGFLRVFLDEGQPLFDLLPRVRPAAPELVDAILRAQPTDPPTHSASPDDLASSLSGQELRVLKLIVSGKSNAEIAAALVISVGTAKWHVHNVLQKLGTRNRPQTIARARELGL